MFICSVINISWLLFNPHKESVDSSSIILPQGSVKLQRSVAEFVITQVLLWFSRYRQIVRHMSKLNNLAELLGKGVLCVKH